MANSQYGYVRSHEPFDPIAPSNWIVIRLDGRAFTKLCTRYAFAKPNDRRALDLMNAAAAEVVRALPDVVLAYGQSDEYSFVFGEDTRLFERRGVKLVSTVVSQFTAEYAMLWPRFMAGVALERPYPTFDGRWVAYPKRRVLRDYLAWRQVDCHVNNLYNTTFWNLVLKGGMSGTGAEERLKGTVAGDKNEILFGQFGINYNEEPEMFRKGTVVYRAYDDGVGGEEKRSKGVGKGGGGGEAGDGEADGGAKPRDVNESVRNASGEKSKTQLEKEKKRKRKARIAVEHVDLIGDAFWEARPWILGDGGE